MNAKKLIASFINGLVIWLVITFAVAAVILLDLYGLFAGFHTAFEK